MKKPETAFETTGNLIEKMIGQLGELPAAPVILSKAMKLTSDVSSNINDISKNISADQSLAARVIKMSNSPVYGRVESISSLSEAITVLGFNQVKSIIITASTSQMFQSGSQTKIARILWEHSLASALGARLVATKYGGVDKEEAYLCGLLHDIGKLVLLQSAPDIYRSITDRVKESGSPFYKVERDLLGFNHVQVGSVLLKNWRFPTGLTAQIAGHHSSKLSKPESSITLKRVVAVANSIAKYIGAGFFEAYIPEKESVCFVGDRLVDADDLVSLRVATEELFNHEMNSFYD